MQMKKTNVVLSSNNCNNNNYNKNYNFYWQNRRNSCSERCNKKKIRRKDDKTKRNAMMKKKEKIKDQKISTNNFTKWWNLFKQLYSIYENKKKKKRKTKGFDDTKRTRKSLWMANKIKQVQIESRQ